MSCHDLWLATMYIEYVESFFVTDNQNEEVNSQILFINELEYTIQSFMLKCKTALLSKLVDIFLMKLMHMINPTNLI